LGIGVAALTAAASMAVPALATNHVYINSRVKIGSGAPAFHGRVNSSNHACIEQRTVKMFREKNGPDRFLGKDTTNNQGHWKIPVSHIVSGTYYAKVLRRAEGAAGTVFVCKGNVSDPVVAD
jgi:hypothetical protein